MTKEQLQALADIMAKPDKDPMYKRLSAILFSYIERGIIAADEKLPPIRTLAGALGVNNVTVVNAYKLLENRKAAYSIVGSGTYAAHLEPEFRTFMANTPRPKPNAAFFAAAERSAMIQFANTSASVSLFPVEAFKAHFNEVLERDKGGAFGYEDSGGYTPLCAALCEAMEMYGIKTNPERVQIVSGAQQGVDTIAKAMLLPNDSVIVENPTYYGAVGSFLSRGALVSAVPMQADGMDMNRLEILVRTNRPKLVYVMTSYQTPTTASYSLEKKRALLMLASKYDFYIVEEDNQGDFYFGDKPNLPLKALDNKNRVIYIKSFSKILMPGLRLGFMLLPKAVQEQVAAAKYTTDVETSGFIQRAFTLFIQSGGWSGHIAKMRGIYKARYDEMLAASNRYLAGRMAFAPPNGGLNLWYTLDKRVSAAALSERLAQVGVIVTPGALFSLHGEELPNIRLSFANVEVGRIAVGIEKIAVAFDAALGYNNP